MSDNYDDRKAFESIERQFMWELSALVIKTFDWNLKSSRDADLQVNFN